MTINADEDLIDQVWINLIHNRIKFTPNNGKITVRLIKKDTDRLAVIIGGKSLEITLLGIVFSQNGLRNPSPKLHFYYIKNSSANQCLGPHYQS